MSRMGERESNPKFEIRNKFELSKGKNDQDERLFRISLLEHLVIVSSFELRISSLCRSFMLRISDFPPEGQIVFPLPYPSHPCNPRLNLAPFANSLSR